MNEDQIKSETHDKPRYTGKLRALIEARRAKVSKKQTIEDLLKACRQIPHPIYEDVIQQWQKGEMFYPMSSVPMGQLLSAATVCDGANPTRASIRALAKDIAKYTQKDHIPC